MADRPKILVVEDNALNMELVHDILSDSGYDVIEAEDGAAGLRLAREESPDLILMDVQLPGVDGLAVTRELRVDPRTRHIPVIAVTAHAMKGEQDRATAAGCAGFITKPLRMRELMETVARHLPKRPT